MKKIIAVIAVILFLVIVSMLISNHEFHTYNFFSSFSGLAKILFTKKQYTVIQNELYKIMIAESRRNNKTSNDILDEYMEEIGFYREDQMGSCIIYYNGNQYKGVYTSGNSYYSVWEFK